MSLPSLPVEVTDSVRSFAVEPGFSIRQVDGRRGGEQQRPPSDQKPVSGLDPDTPLVEPKKITSHPKDDTATLGPVLGKFVGTFQGTGMNTIFRPRSNFVNPRQQDNLLEINLTRETLQFMESSVLGKVPNRGFDNQGDVFLTGIPYQQTVSDHLNEKTGLADLAKKKVDLHFEQGLFMRTPATESPDTQGTATISRMGSIPHGTTINAQDFEPKAKKSGSPDIPDIEIIPFIIGGSQKNPRERILFDNMDVKKEITEATTEKDKFFRIPSSLAKFFANKTIKPESVNNPNQFLKDMNEGKTIESHWTFNVRTKHPNLGGGGLANIAFLQDGVKPTIPTSARGNANAVNMTCTYWVSTVKHQVLIEPGDHTKVNPIVTPKDTKEGFPGPEFEIELKRKVKEPQLINVTSTQIQYSQNVTLDFGPLSWPHISVATLVPALPILVPANSPALRDVE